MCLYRNGVGVWGFYGVWGVWDMYGVWWYVRVCEGMGVCGVWSIGVCMGYVWGMGVFGCMYEV